MGEERRKSMVEKICGEKDMILASNERVKYTVSQQEALLLQSNRATRYVS